MRDFVPLHLQRRACAPRASEAPVDSSQGQLRPRREHTETDCGRSRRARLRIVGARTRQHGPEATPRPRGPQGARLHTTSGDDDCRRASNGRPWHRAADRGAAGNRCGRALWDRRADDLGIVNEPSNVCPQHVPFHVTARLRAFAFWFKPSCGVRDTRSVRLTCQSRPRASVRCCGRGP
jgi:hypothetical protein